MPTTGWILERAIERYNENTERKAPSGPPRARVYLCPFCESVRNSPMELDQHVADAHTAARPFLMINGREPGSLSEWRRPIHPNQVHVSNATGIELNWGGQRIANVEPKDLVEKLSRFRQEDAVLTLTNSREKRVAAVSQSYKLSFRIAGAMALASVERAFSEHITHQTLSMAMLECFAEDERCLTEGKDYAIALSQYILGILHKEDPKAIHLTTPSSLYRENYVRAELALRDIPRALSQLIAQITRLALNDFSENLIETGNWELDLTYMLLSNPDCSILPSEPPDSEERHPICPIDHATGRIITLAARMCSQERWSPLLDSECRSVVASSVLDADDQVKAAAIWALAAWRLDAKASAAEPLRKIQATFPFSIWAEPYLNSLPR